MNELIHVYRLTFSQSIYDGEEYHRYGKPVVGEVVVNAFEGVPNTIIFNELYVKLGDFILQQLERETDA